MLREYYAYHQWNWENGKPTQERLVELGLGHVAEKLYPR